MLLFYIHQFTLFLILLLLLHFLFFLFLLSLLFLPSLLLFLQGIFLLLLFLVFLGFLVFFALRLLWKQYFRHIYTGIWSFPTFNHKLLNASLHKLVTCISTDDWLLRCWEQEKGWSLCYTKILANSLSEFWSTIDFSNLVFWFFWIRAHTVILMRICPLRLELSAKLTVRASKTDEPSVLLFNWYLLYLLTNSGLVESEIVKQNWLVYSSFSLFSCFLSEFLALSFSFVIAFLFPLLLHLNHGETILHFDGIFECKWELPRNLGAWEFWETNKSWDLVSEIAECL